MSHVTAPTGTVPTELRLGRNFVRTGDIIKVTPSSPGKRDGFVTKLKAFEVNAAGEITAFRCPGKKGESRTFFIDRLQRVDQTTAKRKAGAA